MDIQLLAKRLKRIIIGDARGPFDSNIFHKLSLIALLIIIEYLKWSKYDK